MAARSFVWISLGGGAWSLGSNWADVTEGTSPSLVSPGAQDSVTVNGPSGAQLQTISGGGAAASALFVGNSLLTGTYAFGALGLGAGGGLLQLGAGASLKAGLANIGSGSLLVGQAARLGVSGTVALGTSGVAGAALNATGGSSVSVLAVLLSDAHDSIYVDASSIVEVGSVGGGQAGALTIDAGSALIGQGSANAFGHVVNNGTLTASGGTLSVGTLSGTGSLVVAAGATLALDGSCAAGQSVTFAGANATLAITEEFFAPAGTLTGFVAGDAIDLRGSPISAATFSPSGGGGGVLNLFYGSQIATHLTLAGDYTSQVFLLAGDGAGGTLVTVAPGGGGGNGHASPGTTTPDQYVWRATSSGAWNSAANWQDVTTGAAPAAIAPGKNNLVTLSSAADSFTVIAGPANASALSLTGEVALSGTYAIGTLTVGQAQGSNPVAGTLDLLPATTITTGNASIADGAISVSGSAASLVVAGTLLLGGGITGIGLPIVGLSATAGASVQAAGLAMGGGSGATLTTDTTGTIEIGTAGGAAGGAVTIDAGAQLSGNGAVNPFGTIVDNGTVLATGGTLTLGSVSGSGSLVVAAGATLELMTAIAVPVVLSGSVGTAGSTLAIANERAMPTGTLAGWAVGDALHLEGSTLTGVQFVAAAAGGTLLLFYGQTAVGRLTIGGSLAGSHFVLSPDGIGGTYVTLVSNTNGGGGNGQTGTDQLAWTTPTSGSWSRAANWTDVTIGTQASLPPGAQTPVQIAGPGGVAFQSIAGTGTCASLSLSGNTVLTGSFTSVTLTVGQVATSTAGTLEIGPLSSLTASQGNVADGALVCIGNGALLTISGTLALGGAAAGVGQPDTLLAASGRAGVQLGGLTLGGGDSNALTVDSTAWVEVGTAGGAALGALTVDAGAIASGDGTLNALGSIIDNGTILAQGGTLLAGSVTGGGVLDIGTEATLALQGTDTCPIAFTGSGATLIMPATALLPTGAISGFAAGDSIVTGSPVDAVTYQPGAAGVGTLSLMAGGVAVGQLLLAGNFAGDTFAAVPDGNGAAIIIVRSPVDNGPPAGTATPDAYRWTGAAGGLAWDDAGNWVDATQGSQPASVAPGQNDLVSIAGGNGAVLAIAGPADAASLSLSGTVCLTGAFAIGQLNVGSAQAGALLALQGGAAISASGACIVGGVAMAGGLLSLAGTLAVGQAGAAAGVVSVAGSGILEAATVQMWGNGSALSAAGNGSIEIGGAGGAAAGSITIDAGALLQGAGAVDLAGTIVDQGTILASGGTLVLGSVTGAGTLLVGTGAELVLTSGVDAALTVDFAGAGTLALAGLQPAAPMIDDFGTGDSILLPVFNATAAVYAATGAGIGVLTISAGTQTLSQLTLLGSQSGRLFTVTGTAGGTLLTTQPAKNAGSGDPTMSYPSLTSGQYTRGDLLNALTSGFPYVSPADIGNILGNQGIYLDYSTDGLAPAQTVFGGAGEPIGANVEVIAPLIQTGQGGGPGLAVALQQGYSALLLEGNENLSATDGLLGNALIVGNYGADELAALGDGDTLVGATGANTTFYAALQNHNGGTTLPVDVYVHGGGNDTIATNYDNAAITTSGGSSVVYLGASDNTVVLNGADTVVCGGVGGSDTIQAQATSSHLADIIFSSGAGLLNFIGGANAASVVGNGAQIEMQGGSGNHSILWAGSSNAQYFGGSGSAIIVGGSAYTYVQGGSGAVTAFGGTGNGVFSGGPGSIFVVGLGASTVQAVAGDAVYVMGAAPVSVAGSAGATVFGGTSIGNDIFQAGSGAETMWGGAGDDLFIAGSGSDVFCSDGGNDIFSFTSGVVAGRDTLYGFVPGQSTIALHGYGNAVPQMTTGFGNTSIHLQDGATIIVANVTNLSAANFTFG